jgi:hypothetical protein
MVASQGREPEIRKYWDADYPDKVRQVVHNVKAKLIDIRTRSRRDLKPR